MTKTKSIEVKNFTKKFGDFTAVDNITFDVEEGSVFAFLGPNGAGKTTTISTLCTIQEKTTGQLTINGFDLDHHKDKVRKEIGIVFQDSTMDHKLTIEENLKLHCDFYNVPKKEIPERISFVLQLVDLENRRKSPIESLSGGMKRRAEIARGLVHYPKVLFLDEPTTGLDPQTRVNVWDYILKLQKQKNITIFLTTHYMEEAEICDQVAIIDKGKIVAHDTPLNLKKKYSSTRMNIESPHPTRIKSYFEEKNIKYLEKGTVISAFVQSTVQIMEIMNDNRNIISDLEVSKGSLNDVFLAITGKEIRE